MTYIKVLVVLIFFFTTCQGETLHSQIAPVFKKYKELNAKFVDTANSDKQVKLKTLEAYMYSEFREALEFLKQRYCLEPDEDALNAFISVLTTTSDSAYETPSFILGEMYICQADLIFNKVHSLKKEEKKYIVETLDWGFQNVTYKKENKIDNYKELFHLL